MIFNKDKMFKMTLRIDMQLQQEYRSKKILQEYEGKTFSDVVQEAFKSSDIVFVKHLLDLCNTKSKEELEAFYEAINQKQLIQEAVFCYMNYVDPLGFAVALMKKTKNQKQKVKM